MDRVDIHAAHALAQVDAGANLIQRIAPLQRHDGRGFQGVVDVVFRGLLHVDDILLTRNIVLGGRQVHDERAEGEANAGFEAPVLEQHVAFAIGRDAHAPQGPAVGVGLHFNSKATGPCEDREPVAVGQTAIVVVAAIAPEPLHIVMLDEVLVVDLVDRAVVFLDDGLAA